MKMATAEMYLNDLPYLNYQIILICSKNFQNQGNFSVTILLVWGNGTEMLYNC